MTREVSDAAAAFWEGLEEGKLRLPHCDACGEPFFPPGPACPSCREESITWAQTSDAGELYSFTRQHRTPPGFYAPLVIGLVELEAGPRLLSRIDADFESLTLGDRLRIRPCEYDQDYDRGPRSDRPFFVAVPTDG